MRDDEKMRKLQIIKYLQFFNHKNKYPPITLKICSSFFCVFHSFAASNTQMRLHVILDLQMISVRMVQIHIFVHVIVIIITIATVKKRGNYFNVQQVLLVKN